MSIFASKAAACYFGEIAYTNAAPLLYYVDRKECSKRGWVFTPKKPAELNKDIENERIDMSEMSSFSYAENAEKLVLVNDVSVSANSSVGSITLFSKYAVGDLNGKKVGLTSASTTSVNLLKILMKKCYKATDVQYESYEPRLEPMLECCDAALLIGDEAIAYQADERFSHLYQYDLGQLWHQFTGLPMTFAVIAVNKNTLKRRRGDVEAMIKEIKKSKKISKDRKFMDLISVLQTQKIKAKKGFWKNYFQKNLSYELGSKELQGMKIYFRYCTEVGLLKKEPHIEFVN